jgi:hypothetical protein
VCYRETVGPPPTAGDPAVLVVGAGVVAMPARVIVPGLHPLTRDPAGCAGTTSYATTRPAAARTAKWVDVLVIGVRSEANHVSAHLLEDSNT